MYNFFDYNFPVIGFFGLLTLGIYGMMEVHRKEETVYGTVVSMRFLPNTRTSSTVITINTDEALGFGTVTTGHREIWSVVVKFDHGLETFDDKDIYTIADEHKPITLKKITSVSRWFGTRTKYTRP